MNMHKTYILKDWKEMYRSTPDRKRGAQNVTVQVQRTAVGPWSVVCIWKSYAKTRARRDGLIQLEVAPQNVIKSYSFLFCHTSNCDTAMGRQLFNDQRKCGAWALGLSWACCWAAAWLWGTNGMYHQSAVPRLRGHCPCNLCHQHPASSACACQG